MDIIRARYNPNFPGLVEVFFSNAPDFPIYVLPSNPRTDTDRLFLQWIAQGGVVEEGT
jgi:hypothetical protein